MRDWTRERQAVEATGTYGEVDPVGLGRVTVCDARDAFSSCTARLDTSSAAEEGFPEEGMEK